MERRFVAENARELERLHSLVGRLTDEDLSLFLENGWTIAVALAGYSQRPCIFEAYQARSLAVIYCR